MTINNPNASTTSYNNVPLTTNNNINAPLATNNTPITTSTPNFTPNINYDQILAMAIRFNDWPLAFKELQKVFKMIPVIEIPPILHNQLIPNYHKLNQSDQSTLPIIPPPSPSLPDNNHPYYFHPIAYSPNQK